MEEIKTLSALVENESEFLCTGYSTIKVSKRIDGETKAHRLKIPIRSRGILEYQQELSDKAPRPPVISKVIKANSEIGRQIGIEEDTERMVFDFTDPAYVDALEKHNREFVWKIAVHAIDIEWKFADGSEAKAYEDKKRILQSNGLTGQHIDQINRDVVALARFADGREDFLSAGS